jgi:molecular chaperone GrpE
LSRKKKTSPPAFGGENIEIDSQDTDVSQGAEHLNEKDLTDQNGAETSPLEVEEGEMIEPASADVPPMSPQEIEKLIQEKNEYYDRLLRTQADFDNYRKRVQREQSNLIRYGSETALREILPVIDNIERAVDSARTHGDSNSQLREGIELILTQFRSALEKLNVKPIETVGHPFDPNKHDALLRVHAPDASDGAVVNEIRKGYYLHDRVIRPAQVTVGIHEPEPDPKETANEDE